jgi:hypothetical protein
MIPFNVDFDGWWCDENQWQLGTAIMITNVEPKVRYELREVDR